MRLLIVLFCFSAFGLFASGAGEKPDFPQVMKAGAYERAIASYQSYLAGNPQDAQGQAELGVIQSIRALEFFFQQILAHSSPTVRMWLPQGAGIQEKAWSYKGFQEFLSQWNRTLALAIETLSKARGEEILISIRVNRIALDYNGDGRIQDFEYLEAIFDEFNTNPDFDHQGISSLALHLDQADILWLEGYMSLLKGISDILLAYNLEDLFYRFGGFVFNVDFEGYRPPPEEPRMIPLFSTQKMKDARFSFLRTFRLGQELWDHVLAETDDDREWIAGPHQTSPFKDIQVNGELIRAWKSTLKLWEEVLEGRRLLDVGERGRGLNLKIFFESPRGLPLSTPAFEEFLVHFLSPGPVIDPMDPHPEGCYKSEYNPCALGL